MTDAGAILVRIPVCDGYAFDRYREHWVHLDAPRHLFLHTRCSVGILAEQLGLDVRHVSYDSTGSQFTGSELYRRDIPMNASEREKALFTRAERRRFDERARALNAEGRGDMALFVLRAA